MRRACARRRRASAHAWNRRRHVALQLYEGRTLDTITQAETLDHFRPIREDLDRIGRASSVLEAVDQITQEREPNAALFAMLVGALRALSADDHPLIAPAFFWKLLALEGLSPVVDACVVCGSEQDLCAFTLEDGGVVCSGHRRGVPLPAESIVLLRLILGGRLGVALAQPVTKRDDRGRTPRHPRARVPPRTAPAVDRRPRPRLTVFSASELRVDCGALAPQSHRHSS